MSSTSVVASTKIFVSVSASVKLVALELEEVICIGSTVPSVSVKSISVPVAPIFKKSISSSVVSESVKSKAPVKAPPPPPPVRFDLVTFL